MASRVTQVTRRVLGTDLDANARVTQVTRRVLAIGEGNARVTQVVRKVLVKDWATGQSAEVVFFE